MSPELPVAGETSLRCRWQTRAT